MPNFPNLNPFDNKSLFGLESQPLEQRIMIPTGNLWFPTRHKRLWVQL